MKWLKDKPTSYKVFLAVLALFFAYYGYSSGRADLNGLPQTIQDSPLFAAFRAEYMYSPKEALLGDFNGDEAQDLAIVYSAGLHWKMVVVVGGESTLITEPVPAPKEEVALSFDETTGTLLLSGSQKGTPFSAEYVLEGANLVLQDSADDTQ